MDEEELLRLIEEVFEEYKTEDAPIIEWDDTISPNGFRYGEEERFQLMDEEMAKTFPVSFGNADDVNRRMDEVEKEIEADKKVRM